MRFAAGIPGGMEMKTIETALKELVSEQRAAKKGLSIIVKERSIHATNATDQLLGQLNLTTTPELLTDEYIVPHESNLFNFNTFVWSWRKQEGTANDNIAEKKADDKVPEADSYEALAKHIESAGYVCINVSNGQRYLSEIACSPDLHILQAGRWLVVQRETLHFEEIWVP